MDKLKYGEIYEVNISGKNYKGIYIGEKTSAERLEKNNVMVINNPYFNETTHRVERNFSVILFDNYAFRSLYNDWILNVKSTIDNISKEEKDYLEELVSKIQ